MNGMQVRTSTISGNLASPGLSSPTGEEALQLRQSLDAAGIGIWRLERRSGIVSWNEGLATMLGLPPERQFADLATVLGRIPEEDRRQVRLRLQAALLTGACDFEHRIFHEDGSIRWVRTTGSAVRGTDGDHCFTGVLIDNTTSRLGEEELRRSAQTLRVVQETVDIGSFVTESDGSCVGSPELYSHFGLDRATKGFGFESLMALVHPDDCDELRASIQASLRDGSGHRHEFRIIRADTGEVRWASTRSRLFRDADGEVIRSIGAHLDITEHKRIEQDLRRSREQLSMIFNQALVGIMHRQIHGNVLMVNRRFCDLIGRTAEEIATLGPMDYTHPDDRAATAALLNEHRVSGRAFTTEKRYQRPDGSIVWCEVHVSFVLDAQGVAASTVVIANDISERKRSEQEQEEAKRLLQLALDGAAAGTWEWDIDAQTITLDRRCQEIYDLPPDGPPTMPAEDWLNFVTPAGINDAADMALGATRSWEGPGITASGRVRWLRTFGRPVPPFHGGRPHKIVGLQLDETERRAADEALRKSEERLRMVQEAACIGSYEIFADARPIYSPEFYSNLGLPQGTPLTYPDFLRLVHPDDRAEVERMLLESKTRDGFENTYRIVRADTGEVRWVLNRTRIHRSPDGAFLRSVGALLDIHGRKLAELALRESEALSRGIVEATEDCIGLLDLGGRLVFMNEPGLRAIEIADVSSLLGRPWVSFWRHSKHAEIEAALKAARSGGTGRFTALNPTIKGTQKWWDVVVSPVLDDRGRPKQLVTIARDITEQRDAVERVRWSANHDALTGLPNRAMFQERLNSVLAADRTGSCRAALLLLDLDRFKEVNDSFGHGAGDLLLQGFGDRLRSCVAGDDMVARLGGDEFAIIIADIASEAEVHGFVVRLIAALAEPLIHEGREIDFRASIGGAMFPRDARNAADLFQSADLALYSCKEDGRGRFVMFEPSLRTEMMSRASMIDMARSAIAEDRILPFYQPKVRLVGGSVVGFEALLRWSDGAGALRTPGEIAAALEDAETVWPIGQRMHERVIADMRGWLHAGIAFGHVAINAAASEFRHDNFAELLLERLEVAGVPCRCVEIEVTESVFMGTQACKVARALNLLHDSGVRIALDDFGTGFSSLSHLKEFPVDVLKIDRSFIGHVEQGKDLAIVRAVLDLGRSLNIAVVAEGIETETQADFLRLQGCALGQGFLYGKPAPAASVPDWIRRRGNAAT